MFDSILIYLMEQQQDNTRFGDVIRSKSLKTPELTPEE